MKLEFSRETFTEYSNTKFHEHPYSMSGVVPRVQTDGWAWRN